MHERGRVRACVCKVGARERVIMPEAASSSRSCPLVDDGPPLFNAFHCPMGNKAKQKGSWCGVKMMGVGLKSREGKERSRVEKGQRRPVEVMIMGLKV